MTILYLTKLFKNLGVLNVTYKNLNIIFQLKTKNGNLEKNQFTWHETISVVTLEKKIVRKKTTRHNNISFSSDIRKTVTEKCYFIEKKR